MLEADIFDEVKTDEEATQQALWVVVLSVLGHEFGADADISEIPLMILLAVGYWFLGARLIHWLGTKVFAESEKEPPFECVLRTYGFSASPYSLGLLGRVMDLDAWGANYVILLWVFLADVVAVRQALGYRGTARVLGILVIVYLVSFVIDREIWVWLGIESS